tara:strand:+ start:198 stop:1589 length:1392 start_codon:yes stop_codon:yes gene_type:complete
MSFAVSSLFAKEDKMLTINSPRLRTPNLLQNTQSITSTYEKLASGKRINSAKDDAAGLQISHRLTTQIAVKQQTLRNLQDGISYGQVADAGLSELTDSLQRMRTLALQAANGSNTDIDREALNEEFSQLRDHINSVVANTEIFGKKPLMSKPEQETNLDNVPVLNEVFSNNMALTKRSGEVSLGLIPAGSTNVRIQIDSFSMNDDINIFSQFGEHLVGQNLSSMQSVIENNLFTPANGYQGTEVYDNSSLFNGGGFNYPATNSQSIKGMNFRYSGNGNPGNNLEEVIIDNVTEPLLLTVIGNGSFNITASWDSLGSLNSSSAESSDGPMMVTSTDQAVGEDGYIIFEDIDASAGSLTIDGITISSEDLAQNAIARIDTALSRIGGFRAEIGAKMNAIESTMRNQSNQSSMLSSANQRIEDTDFAKVMAEKVSLDIVQQASVSVAMQARDITKNGILSLLGQLE